MTVGRRFMSGAGVLTVTNGAARLVSFISMPILTRALSPQAYGTAAVVGTTVSLAAVVALAGIDVSYARACAVKQTGGADVFCWRFALGSAVVTASIVSTVWLIVSSQWAVVDAKWTAFVWAGVFLSVAATMAQTRARLGQRYTRLGLTNVASGILAAGVSIFVAAIHPDALALIFALLVAYLVPIVILGIPSPARLLTPSGLAPLRRRELVGIGIAASVTAPMYWVLSSSDRWFLQFLKGPEVVGIYSIAYSIGSIGMMANAAIAAVWLPEATREYESHSEVAKFSLGAVMTQTVVAMILIWLSISALGGDGIRVLAGERFHGAAEYVPWIAGGVLCYGIAHLSFSSLILIGAPRSAIPWWIVGGLACLVLNMAFVPTGGAMGAARAQCLSFAFIAIGTFISAQQRLPLNLGWAELIAFGLLTGVAAPFISVPWNTQPALSALLKIPVLALVASGGMLFFRWRGQKARGRTLKRCFDRAD